MPTKQDIMRGYKAEHGKPMSESNYEAYLDFLLMFGITKITSYKDGQTQIIEALRDFATTLKRTSYEN